MRILLVNSHGTDPSYGGAEAYVARLAEGIRDRGAEIRVLAAFPGPSTVPAASVRTLHGTDWREDRVRRLRNHADDVVSRPGRPLAEALAWASPDVVHTNNLPGLGTGIWEAARRAGVPVVHTVHDYHLLCPRTTLLQRDGRPCRPHPALCGLRTRRMSRWAGAVSHVLGVSQFILDRHAGIFPAAPRQRVLHPFDAPPPRAPAPPGPKPSVLGYLGALERAKGVDRLLAAAPRLRSLGWSVRIAGDGKLRGAVESSDVDYVGVVGGALKASFLAGCDIGIVPSVWDEPGAPPFAVLDWLNAGRPVLVSTRGGINEALEHLSGAIPITPEPEAIAAAIGRLANNAAWRAAVAEVRPPTDPSRTLKDWLDTHERVYASLVDR
jgi:glycosyltransferase involved in cell wall biosynthesis